MAFLSGGLCFHEQLCLFVGEVYRFSICVRNSRKKAIENTDLHCVRGCEFDISSGRSLLPKLRSGILVTAASLSQSLEEILFGYGLDDVFTKPGYH